MVAVFLPEQVAQAIEYDPRVFWRHLPQADAFAPAYLRDPAELDIPLSVRRILLDIANKPIDAIQISPTITVKLDQPLKISKARVEEIYRWLQGKPCGSKAL